MNIKFTAKTITLAVSLSLLNQVAFAEETADVRASCPAESVEVLSSSCKKRDKGTEPEKSCTAKIIAPEGYFIFRDDVKYNTKGTSHGRSTKFSSKPYAGLETKKQKSFFSEDILSSASFYSRCKRGKNYSKIRTCYAAANISAKAYPHECLKPFMQSIVNSIADDAELEE